MLVKDIIDDVKVIYREDDEGLEIENIIFEKILKKGVWVLYGKKDGIYECLNVGKSINVGSEILYDIACLKFLGYEENSNANLKYINQFAEFKDFNYKSKMTQEYLYPYISKTYKALVFIYVWNMNDEVIEKALAWKLHATFWRDKTPFKNSRKNFYKENKEGKLQNLLANFNYKNDVNSIVEKIKKLLNCG